MFDIPLVPAKFVHYLSVHQISAKSKNLKWQQSGQSSHSHQNREFHFFAKDPGEVGWDVEIDIVHAKFTKRPAERNVELIARLT